MTYAIVVMTHSDFNDVLKIQMDMIEKNVPEHIPVYIFSNVDYSHKRFKTIMFDDSLPYIGRQLYCLKQITEEYVIIVRDSNIIINYDDVHIQTLIQTMDANAIDRINLYHIAECEYPIKINDRLYLHKHTNIHNYIYNVQPAIVRRIKLVNVFEKYPNKSYIEAECREIQEACRDTMSVYVIHDIRCIQSMFHKTSKEFCFLTITSAFKFLPPQPDLDTFVKTVYDYIYDMYIKNGTRSLHSSLPWLN